MPLCQRNRSGHKCHTDARALRYALAKALDHIPDHDALHGCKSKKLRDVSPQSFAERVCDDVYVLVDPENGNAREWFSGNTKENLIALVEHFRESGFEIVGVPH